MAASHAVPAIPAMPEDAPEQKTLHRHLLKTRICMYYGKGMCHYGDDCMFAHSTSELQSTPNLRKTRLCKAFEKGICGKSNCNFAHGEEELVKTELFHKKTLCVWFQKGTCRDGPNCRFAHGEEELRRPASCPQPPAAAQLKFDMGESVGSDDTASIIPAMSSHSESSDSDSEGSVGSAVEDFLRLGQLGKSTSRSPVRSPLPPPPGLSLPEPQQGSAAAHRASLMPMKIHPVLSKQFEPMYSVMHTSDAMSPATVKVHAPSWQPTRDTSARQGAIHRTSLRQSNPVRPERIQTVYAKKHTQQVTTPTSPLRIKHAAATVHSGPPGRW